MNAYYALSSPERLALGWLVSGNCPDMPALAGLERDGLARRDRDTGEWVATDHGRAVYHERFTWTDPYPVPDSPAARRDPFYNPPTDEENSA